MAQGIRCIPTRLVAIVRRDKEGRLGGDAQDLVRMRHAFQVATTADVDTLDERLHLLVNEFGIEGSRLSRTAVAEILGLIRCVVAGDQTRTTLPFRHGIYRHFKGTLYSTLMVTKDSETLESRIVYVALDKLSEYACDRTLAMFCEVVKWPDDHYRSRWVFERHS